MEKHGIACIYYPTSVLFVDDNAKFLKNITQALPLLDPHIQCVSYTDPKKALQFIEQQQEKNKANIILKTIATNIADLSLQTSGKLPIQFDISNLYKLAYDKDRFKEASVVVVDYSMPNISGDQFCQKLANSPIKKIMLTGEADTELAVELFNKGIIDAFLMKGKSNFEDDLVKSIHLLQKRYFQNLTNSIINRLSTNSDSCLMDPIFIDFFYDICKEHYISDYFLIDLSGSYLLLKNNGAPLWLVIKSQNEINDYVEFFSDAGANEKTIDKIKNGKEIPYFFNSTEYINSIEVGIEKYLHPAKKLEGRKPYYYFLTDKLLNFPFDKTKVVGG